MFMHQHEVNQRRLAQGQLPINSLWCWGSGHTTARVTNCDWYCEDAILNPFAESLGLKLKSIDQLDSNSESRDSIIIDLRLLEATKLDQAMALDELLLDIEKRIFRAVFDSAVKPVWLRCGCELDFRIGTASQLKFWRRPKNLADWQRVMWSAGRDIHS